MAASATPAHFQSMQENIVSHAEKPVHSPLQCQTGRLHRILVVDDESCIRRLNAELLLRSGYHVDTAEDGADAWRALGAERYDLLITDNNMPRVTGVELIKKVRGARMELPVIMATGTLPEEEFALNPWLRPDATLLKPYTVGEMLRAVKEVLSGAGNAREQVTSQRRWQNQPSVNGWQL